MPDDPCLIIEIPLMGEWDEDAIESYKQVVLDALADPNGPLWIAGARVQVALAVDHTHDSLYARLAEPASGPPYAVGTTLRMTDHGWERIEP